jgi:hypothetical protein
MLSSSLLHQRCLGSQVKGMEATAGLGQAQEALNTNLQVGTAPAARLTAHSCLLRIEHWRAAAG